MREESEGETVQDVLVIEQEEDLEEQPTEQEINALHQEEMT